MPYPNPFPLFFLINIFLWHPCSLFALYISFYRFIYFPHSFSNPFYSLPFFLSFLSVLFKNSSSTASSSNVYLIICLQIKPLYISLLWVSVRARNCQMLTTENLIPSVILEFLNHFKLEKKVIVYCGPLLVAKLLYKSKCPSVCPNVRMPTTFRGKRDFLGP